MMGLYFKGLFIMLSYISDLCSQLVRSGAAAYHYFHHRSIGKEIFTFKKLESENFDHLFLKKK